MTIKDNTETLDLDERLTLLAVQLGVNFALACLVAGKHPNDVIDALVQEGGE